MSRSSQAAESQLHTLNSFLGRLAAMTRSEAVVVSDDDGLVIGGFGVPEHQSALAAWSTAPRAARSQAKRLLADFGLSGPVHRVPVKLRSGRVHLACVGGRAPCQDDATRGLDLVLG